MDSPPPNLSAPAGNAQTHMQRFGRAYLIGTLFVVVNVCTAITGEFEDIKPEDLAKFTNFQWFLHWTAVVVSAGTVVLAFLNQSVPHSPPQQTNNTNP
jgi:hypothetical protein